MRLHRLTLQAIGPYRGEQSIDFSSLGASGVFLLDGPTGSGKSTIIDAIVFGLYGGLAGSTSASSKDRLHSHHAPAGVEPFVELVFETGAGIYRVRRSPQWERPKARGTGFTRQNERVVLERLLGVEALRGEPISSSTQEVGHEMPAIIGLTREQFTQTVVLPQGEFARFLGATGEQRREVLQSLFGTRLYDDTTAVLADLRRAANVEVGAARKAVDEAMAALRGAADDDSLTADTAPDAVAAFTATAAETAAAREEATRRRQSAEAEWAAQTALAEALRRRGTLLERRDALAAEALRVQGERERVDGARRAATVRPARAAHDAAAVHRSAAAAAVSEAEANDRELAALDDPALEQQRDRLLTEIGTLSTAVALERSIAERAAALENDSRVAADGAAATASAAAALAERAASRQALADALATSTAQASGRDCARQAVADAEAAWSAARERDSVAARVDAVRQEVATASATAEGAVHVENELRLRRIRGMAGEIASTLVDGEPCAVCGATSHPSPAMLTADHPTDDDIDAAEAARRAAEARLQQHRDTLAGLTASFDALVARVGDGATDTLNTAVQAARESALAAERADAAAVAAATALDEFDRATSVHETALHEATVRDAAAAARLDSLRQALDDDLARVAAALDGRADSCSELSARLASDERRTSALRDPRPRLAQARVDEAAREAELGAALEAAGFASVEQAQAATLPNGEIDRLAATVAAHERDTDRVAEQLADEAIARLTGDEVVDVEGAAARADAAREADRVAADAASVAGDRARRAPAALTAVDEAARAAEAASAEARAVVRMADVTAANGPENLRGVTLGTYVLLRRFDDVLAAANSRLAVMSSGRYRLESSDVREKGSASRRTGLALAIRDNTTDTTRDPKSFSGGETFYASLSLALGLADVVQAEAGGIDLGTLFVDEGFGSLDPETLDAVMSELGRLSDGGRSVGIVSHVDELKQRIPDRIEVRRLPDGSSTLRSTLG